ncbi:MAG TPA: hypothetical protein VF331_06765 [Polyangiales bacterium]
MKPTGWACHWLLFTAFAGVGAFTVAGAATGCGLRTHGKLTEQECRGTTPTPAGERPAGCADPACWYYDFCATPSTPALSGTHGDGGTAARAIDGSTPAKRAPDAAASPGDDGGTLSSHDASVIHDPCAGVTCKAGSTCVNGTCDTAISPGRGYYLTVTAAAVPVAWPGAAGCIDTPTADDFCSLVPLFSCGDCWPDPYVITFINGAMVCRNAPVTNATAPSWSAPKCQVTLTLNDTIEFRVMDSDPGSSHDEEIFRCSVMFADVTTSLLQCKPAKGMTIAPPIGGDWFVNAELSPLPTTQ